VLPAAFYARRNLLGALEWARFSFSGWVNEWHPARRALQWLLLSLQANPVFPLLLLAGLFAIIRRLRRGSPGFDGRIWDRLALLAAVQIVIVLAVFTASTQQNFRLLLPLEPYFALVLIWIVHQIGIQWVSRVLTGVFVLQLILVQILDFEF